MTVDDSIFGPVDLSESVLEELIESKPLRRLRGINSGGPCQYIHKGLEGNTRFAHSVGVMLILRRFGASLEEQIAGLLHDVSHTAFSHVADYVFGDQHTQGYQDSVLKEFILESEIPAILTRHGINVKAVLDPHRFTLLEQEIPDLCADRLDYSLRHPFMARHLAPLRPKDVIADIVVREGKLMMISPAVAWKYARAFLTWYGEELAGIRCIAAFGILAKAISRAIEIGALKKEEMFEDDKYVMEKLNACSDGQVREWIACLTPQFECAIDEKNPDLTSGIKNRYIDPLVAVEGGVKRVSQIYPDFARELDDQKAKLDKKEYPIRILKAKKSVQTAGIV